MKDSFELLIHCPRAAVVALIDDPTNLPRWQPDLISFEPLNGTPGEVGSTARLLYRAGKGQLEMIETITDRRMPNEFTGTYATKMGVTTIRNRFVDQGTHTRWLVDTDYAPAGLMKLLAPLLRGVIRKQTLKVIEGFKTFAEAIN